MSLKRIFMAPDDGASGGGAPPPAPVAIEPAPATQAAEPQTDADYFAAAMAAAEEAEKSPPAGEPEKAAAPTPEAAPANPTGSAEPKSNDAAPEINPPAEPAKRPELDRNFEVLARKEATLRKQTEEIAQAQTELASLLAARKAGPLAVLKAMGYTYKQLVEEVVSGKSPVEAEPAKTRSENDPVLQEVRQLRAQLEQEKAQALRLQTAAQIKQIAASSAAKYPLVNEVHAEDHALTWLENFWSQAGKLPIEGDWNASLEVALEVVEGALRKDADRWLTTSYAREKLGKTPPASAPVVKAAANQAQGTAAVPRSLSAAQTAPQTPPPAPKELKTDEDYIRHAMAAMAALEAGSET